LLIVVVLGVHLNAIRHQESGVETHTKLPDHAHVGASLDGLHESLGARLGDGSQVVHEVTLGHTDTGVDDTQSVVGLVGLQVNEQVLLGLQD
jgi:hypothetical protein